MPTYSDEQLQDQLAAYALGALDPEEIPAIERSLGARPEHQEELRQLREVVAQLAYVAPQATPSPAVRQRLMARVAASQATTPATGPSPGVAPQARRPFAWVMPATLTILCAIVLVLGGLSRNLYQSVAALDRANRDLVTTMVQLEQALADTRDRQEALALQLAGSQQQIANLNDRLAQEQYVVSFVTAPGVATRQLTAAQSSAAAQGEMYMYPGNSQAVVIFSGLPTLEPGKVYQFWLADGQKQVAGGTFSVDASGLASLLVQAPREVNAFSQVMVTVEPLGGSTAPGEEVILTGSL